jgi:protein-tyrosine phosphatase
MVDLHSHVIYGIDDGAKTIEDSLEMLRQAESVGIHHIIATPHYNDFIHRDFFEKRDAHCTELNQMCKKEAINITIEAATEVAFLSDWDKVLAETRCTIRQKYILIEFPDRDLPESCLDTIFRVRRSGLIPIIAHPERCNNIQKGKFLIDELLRLGAHFQCDAGSFLGHFGSEAKKCVEKLHARGYFQFIGSDAHETKFRNYLILKNIKDRKLFLNDKLIENTDLPEISLKHDKSRWGFKNSFFEYFKN